MSYKLHVVSTEAAVFKEEINKWFLDLPLDRQAYTTGANLRIRGWLLEKNPERFAHLVVEINGSQIRQELQFPREDVVTTVLNQVAAESPFLNCGFDYSIPYSGQTVRIGFDINGTIHFVRTISIVHYPQVLIGSHDWLFLDNDTNRSVDQYCGRLLISDPDLERWKQYFEATEQWVRSAGAEWAFLIAPSKEYVVPDLFPHEPGTTSPPKQLLEVCHRVGARAIYPLERLARERELSYPKGDTHWTDYGAFLAAEEIRTSFGMAPVPKDAMPLFRLESRLGDLGIKLDPPRSHMEFMADFSSTGSKQVFDSGIHNHGRIWIFENRSSSTDLCSVLFGGSSSNNMSRWLSLFFRRLVFVHTAGGVDPVVLELESPDYVIVQTNARFTVAPLATFIDVQKVIRDKVQSMSKEELQILKSKMEKQDISSYTSWILAAVESLT